MKTKAILVGGIVLALLMATSNVSAQAEEPATLRVALTTADSGDLHPHMASAKDDRGVVGTMFNGLVRYAPGDVRAPFEGDIAESWESNADGTTWTFHLRHGVMCHPWTNPDTGVAHEGYELTSEDVVYSFEAAADPAASAYAVSYEGLTFSAPDAYTFVIEASVPTSETLLLPIVANDSAGLVLCKDAAEDLGDAFHVQPVGTGPFVFSSYTPREHYEVTRNEAYFRGVPKLAGVSFRYMPSESSRKFALRAEEIDVTPGATQTFVEELQRVPGIEVDVYGPGQEVMLFLNMTLEPFDDVLVRRAVFQCLDRDVTRATVGLDMTSNVYTIVPPQIAGGMTYEEVTARSEQDGKNYAYEGDADSARALLAEAGYPDGVSVRAHISAREDYQSYMLNVQAQLRACGIDLALDTVDHATYFAYRLDDVEPLAADNIARPTADHYLRQFFLSSSIVKHGSAPSRNYSHIGAVDVDGDGVVESVDDLIESARIETDPAKQVALWQEAQLKALDWAVMWPGFVLNFVAAKRDTVDWGYDLQSVLGGFPAITELTSVDR